MAINGKLVMTQTLDGDLRGQYADGVLPGPTPVDTSVRSYWGSHSLMVWDAEQEPGSTNESSAAWWLNDMATSAGYTSGYTGSFGQVDYISVPPFAAFGFDNNAFDPWPSGTYQEQDFDYHLMMASNFDFAGMTPAQWLTTAARVFDWQRDNAPEVPIIMCLHFPEPASTPTAEPDENMDATQWQIFRNFTRDLSVGGHARWYADVRNLIASTYPTLTVRMMPNGPIIADIQELASLSSLVFTDYFVDGANHGARLYYFLCAAILYRMTHNELPNANGAYTPPPGFLPTAIENNLTEIFSYIDTRLDYYNTRPGDERIYVYL
jgi:hypothetical protein